MALAGHTSELERVPGGRLPPAVGPSLRRTIRHALVVGHPWQEAWDHVLVQPITVRRRAQGIRRLPVGLEMVEAEGFRLLSSPPPRTPVVGPEKESAVRGRSGGPTGLGEPPDGR